MQTIILPKPRPGSAGKESAVLDDELHVLIRKAYNRTNRAMVRFTAGLGLKPGQPKVLEYLSEHDGCTARDICQGCIIDKSTMAILLPRLEEQGLVRRETSRQDARMAHVYLTEQGWELARAIREGARLIDARSIEGVPESDRAATLRTLRHIVGLDDEALGVTTGLAEGADDDIPPSGSPNPIPQ